MRARTDKTGQGMTEYIVIVILVALAVLAAVTFFGDVLKQKYEVEGAGGLVEKVR